MNGKLHTVQLLEFLLCHNVIEYVYFLLVFYIGFMQIFIFIFLDRCPYLVGHHY